MFLAFWLLRPTYQQEAIWSNIWSTWPSTWLPKSTKNPLKRLPKSIAEGIENRMQVGMGFGTLLERILMDFGSNLGGKLGPSCLQNLSNIDQRTKLKKHLKITKNPGTRGHGSNSGVGPLKLQNPGISGTIQGIRHSSRATRARWRIIMIIIIIVTIMIMIRTMV